MKILSSIAMFLVGAAALASCNGPERTTIDPGKISPAVFTSYPNAKIVLDRNQPDASQVTLGWNAARYGYNAAVKYTIYAYVEQVDGAPIAEIGQTSNTSIAINNKTLNGALVNTLKALPTEPFTFNVKMICSIGATAFDTVSLPISMTVTPYSMEPTPLWVIGDYCGWDHGNATKIYSALSNGIYTGWAYMNKEGLVLDTPTPFAFTPAANWTNKWAGTMDALIKDGGDNIEIPGGYCYLFEVNTITLKATTPKKFQRLGLVGSATPNDWNSPDTELKYDYTTHTFKASGVVMKAGEFKFRANDNWDGPDWGAGEKAGTLNLAGGGGNIAFDDTGTYTVEVDLLKLVPTYTFTKE